MQPPTPPSVVPGGVATVRPGFNQSGADRPRPAFTLVLVRHGESVWNLTNRFTGWTDVDLTAQGRRQAALAGALLRAHGFHIDMAFTSLLKRAIRTLHIMEDTMDALYTPEVKSWRLNERHYGALQGLNKAEMAASHGAEQVHIWRRSYATRPPALEPTDLRHPRLDIRYKELDEKDLPATESLEDCIARTLPFWYSDIAPAVRRGRRVLIAAHGNSLRGVIKHLDQISDADIMMLEVPVGAPLVYELDEYLKPVRHYYLGPHLVAAPPLDVAVLPPLGVPGGSPAAPRPAAAMAAVGSVAPAGVLAPKAASAVPSEDGEAELQCLMQALVSCGATTEDHVHNATTAAALAGDLASAEELMLRGSLAAAKYAFGYIPADAVAAAAESATVELGPAGPPAHELFGVTAEEDAPQIERPRNEQGAGLGGRSTPALGGTRDAEARWLAAFKRAAPLLRTERHVVVAMAAASPQSGGNGGRMAVASLAASLLAVLGAEKKALLAIPQGGVNVSREAAVADRQAGSINGFPLGECPVAWLGGGSIWASGAADAADAQVVAEALTCATGSVWDAPPCKT